MRLNRSTSRTMKNSSRYVLKLTSIPARDPSTKSALYIPVACSPALSPISSTYPKLYHFFFQQTCILKSCLKVLSLKRMYCILKSCLKVLSLKSMYADQQTVHWLHQPALSQCVIQHFSQFELRMGRTSPKTIVFKVRRLP